jgi:broad specificity phosphatase PhoE
MRLPFSGLTMILLRHGQTIFNAVFGLTRIDPGIVDPPLTPEGRRQIAAAAESLAAEPLRRIVASPYTRALETAEIIVARLNLPVAVEPLVGERGHFACDVGTQRSALLQRWPQHRFVPFEEEWWLTAESEEAFSLRCRRFREAVAALEDWPEVLVVTHWGVIRSLTGRSIGNGDWVRFDPHAAIEGLRD